ncbi:MAG TPA: hypothetical protein VLK33_03790 [Terriglobales bacterium]|nr:hypothetical protein [Terriglobales bacterium]
MKTARILSLALAVVLTLVLSASSYAGTKASISKKEVKALIKNAKTSADHQKIATYYRQEAARLNQDSKEHAEMAAIYKDNPPNAALEVKHGSGVEGVSHCNRWAELAKEEAKEADALATLHENMAKESSAK